MERPHFINGEVYHVYNRGVEKREVFLDDKDRFRFIHNLFEFNDEHSSLKLNYYLERPSSEVGLPKMERSPRNLLIKILAFCLMPTHYHLLLRQIREGGITKFMRKLGTGYTNYFNQKQKRAGVLFQGKFKAVRIVKDSHFLYLPLYIHFNPLDLIEPEWRRGSIRNFKEAVKFLESYRWSSYLDYIGIENFPSVTQRDLLTDILGDAVKYRKNVVTWLKEVNLDTISDVRLD